MKRTAIVDPVDAIANKIAKVIWVAYKFITVVLPILFTVWLVLSMCEVVFNLDCFVSGTPYEYNKLNLFFVLENWLSR